MKKLAIKIAIMLALLSSWTMSTVILNSVQDPDGSSVFNVPLASAAESNFRTFDLNQLQSPNQKSSIITADQNSNPVGNFIILIINLIIRISGSVSFLGIIVGGFYIVVSRGNTNLQTKGKEIITFAITGLVISLSAYFVVAFVQGLIFSGQ